MEKHTLTMTMLQATAKQFCHDPINVMTEKHFLVTKFYNSLVAEARQIFEMTRMDAEAWLKAALGPLNLQIKDHEQVLAKRLENFKKIRDNLSSVEERIKHLEKLQVALQQQSHVLARIKTDLDGEDIVGAPPVTQREAAPVA